jgi:16S rRNA (uracil1498-N3)-methyltransferase
MPATPAWPPSSLPRLFLDTPLTLGATPALDPAQSNYLVSVLRLDIDAPLKLFDNRTGEWLARISRAHRKAAEVHVVHHLAQREDVPDLWLAFAPIKHGRLEWIVERATELGVARLLPVVTDRTIVRTVKLDKLRAHAVEAAEQCERTALPDLAEPVSLDRLLADWPAERALLFANERGGAGGLAHHAPAGILVGPEGGFTDAEVAAIEAHACARPISLGPRILRADTACVAAVAAWMAMSGDWPGSAS